MSSLADIAGRTDRVASPEGPAALSVRARTTGEILDDAWRLALADAPLLLALSGLFLAPAAAVLVLLLTGPVPDWPERALWPALLALLVPLTGIGSAACQALFRLRAEGRPASIRTCLKPALRRGLDHAVARGLVLGICMLGLPLLVLPGVAAWIASATVHPLLAAGDTRWPDALRESEHQVQRNTLKASIVMLSRLPLLGLAFLNLHGLVQIILWIADQLAGLDVALPEAVLTLRNPVYNLALFCLTWMLLAPFAEACNYLLYTDARARYEGLDLWYRVRRAFPATGSRVAGTILLVLLGAATTHAADARLETVRAARQEVRQIGQEIRAERHYEGGARWQPRLRGLAERLDQEGSSQRGRYRWFAHAIAGFSVLDREQALRLLADLDRRLALVEESLATEAARGPPAHSKSDIEALLPSDTAEEPAKRTAKKREPPPEPVEEPIRRVDPPAESPKGRFRPAAVPDASGGGFSTTTWMILAGAVAAMVVIALVLQRRGKPAAPPKTELKAKTDAVSLESLLNQADKHNGEGLWRQADDLANAGRLLEAVRTLYLAVLALLHRADLIRYGPTRTNGDYLRQLRPRDEIYRPFRGLTGLFEVKWYGERSCAAPDYDTCRRLAEEVRSGAAP